MKPYICFSFADNRQASWMGGDKAMTACSLGKCSGPLGEASRHSQTRAREAEKRAEEFLQNYQKVAHLFFREASLSLAYRPVVFLKSQQQLTDDGILNQVDVVVQAFNYDQLGSRFLITLKIALTLAAKCAQAMGRFTSSRKCATENVCPQAPSSSSVAAAKCIFSIFSSGPVYKQQVESLRKRLYKEADARTLVSIVACRERKSCQLCDYWRRRSRYHYGLHLEFCLCIRPQPRRSRIDVGMEHGLDPFGVLNPVLRQPFQPPPTLPCSSFVLIFS